MVVVADFDVLVVPDQFRLVVVHALGAAVLHMDSLVTLGVHVDFLAALLVLEAQLVEALALVRVGAEDGFGLVGGKAVRDFLP